MAQAIDAAVASRQDFAVETTLAGRSYLGLIQQWKETGYQVGLAFLCLPSADLAVERVRLRVQQGGHDIPETVIRRRFAQGWANFQDLYRPLVGAWQLYDARVLPPSLIDSGENA